MPLRALLRRAFVNGNRSAPLADSWAENPPIAGGWAPRIDVSIVIPVRGAHDHLQRCFESIIRHPGRVVKTEVVVVADEAERIDIEARWTTAVPVGDVTSGGLTVRFCPGVRFAFTDGPRGFPANVNIGVRAAIGETVVILNSDTVVTPNWVAPLLDALDEGAVAAGPRSNNVSGVQGDFAVFPQRMSVRRLVGFCLALRRADFLEVGGMWEGYGIGNFDDDDLCLRLAMLDRGALMYIPESFVEHAGSASFAELPDADATYARLMIQNRSKFVDRWGWIMTELDKWFASRGVR